MFCFFLNYVTVEHLINKPISLSYKVEKVTSSASSG